MTANLATLKQVCETFEVERYETGNIEKKWKAWLDNFDICTEYEGIENPKKRRAALLAVAGPQVREIHSTLDEEEAKDYETVKRHLLITSKAKRISRQKGIDFYVLNQIMGRKHMTPGSLD